MKQYYVSLACVEPINFDISVKADTESDAVRKAIEAFNKGDGSGDFNPVHGDATLDLSDPDYDGQDVSEFGGVHVEEITND